MIGATTANPYHAINPAIRSRTQIFDEEVLGQDHLVGEGKIIHRMVQAKHLSSMILYGAPGIGKTSIATAIAGSTSIAFRKLNAVINNKKDKGSGLVRLIDYRLL
ncbi:AAA family ATPase [Bacillus licheniformis]|nr:AAA family ATPase [Bacillus licheniformis]